MYENRKKLKGGYRPFLSEDERTLVTTSSRNTVYVYDLENRRLTHSIKTVSNVSKTMVSRDGKRLAAKNTGGVIAVLSLESGEEICRSRMEKREGEPMVFLDDEGLRLLDLDWDGRTMLLDCTSGEHRILDGPPPGAAKGTPRTAYIQYDIHTDRIYKFVSDDPKSWRGRIQVSAADPDRIAFETVWEGDRLPDHIRGICFCKTHNYYIDIVNEQFVVTDKEFKELSRADLPLGNSICSPCEIRVSPCEKYMFLDYGKQCDPRDHEAFRTAKALSGLFALDTLEQVAGFDYDYVSDFRMFHEDERFVLATWQGSYLGSL